MYSFSFFFLRTMKTFLKQNWVTKRATFTTPLNDRYFPLVSYGRLLNTVSSCVHGFYKVC